MQTRVAHVRKCTITGHVYPISIIYINFRTIRSARKFKKQISLWVLRLPTHSRRPLLFTYWLKHIWDKENGKNEKEKVKRIDLTEIQKNNDCQLLDHARMECVECSLTHWRMSWVIRHFKKHSSLELLSLLVCIASYVSYLLWL